MRKLTRKEIFHYTQVVAGAGNETTGRLIGWLAKVLAEHPDQRREVVEDRTLLLRVVDETLRFEPPGTHVARYMASDFEAYGTTVPAGSAMLLMFGAANHDPRRYENPDGFDIHRANISHLTFGKGLHYCLGANLARTRGQGRARRGAESVPEWGIDYGTMQLASTSTMRGWSGCESCCPERLRVSPARGTGGAAVAWIRRALDRSRPMKAHACGQLEPRPRIGCGRGPYLRAQPQARASSGSSIHHSLRPLSIEVSRGNHPIPL